MLGWFVYIGGSTSQRVVLLRIAAGAFGLFVLILVVYAVAPELLGLHKLFGAVGRTETLTGRTDLWATALRAIQERTLVGWGFDSLKSLSWKYGIEFAQFHNGYLDLMVRGGVIALLVVLLILLRGVISGIRCWRKFPKVVVAGLGMCIFVMLHNITEASFARATHPLWVLLLLAVITLGLCDKGSTRSGYRRINPDV